MPWYPQTPHALFSHNGIPRYESLTYLWSTFSTWGAFPCSHQQNTECRIAPAGLLIIFRAQVTSKRLTLEELALLCCYSFYICIYSISKLIAQLYKVTTCPLIWLWSHMLTKKISKFALLFFKKTSQTNWIVIIVKTRFYCVLQLSWKGPFVHFNMFALFLVFHFTSQHQPFLLKHAEIIPQVYLHS